MFCARCWVLKDRAALLLCLFGGVGVGLDCLLDPGLIHADALMGCVGGGGYRPYFENYTVDASIFALVSNRSQPLGCV